MTNSIEKRGYHFFVEHKRKDFLLEKKSFKKLLLHVNPDPKCVTELFGGVGLFASLCPRTWRESYFSYDHDPKCVEIFRRAHPWANVELADSFEVSIPIKTDFVTADFNSYTLLKHLRKTPYSNLISRITSLPRLQWLQITDSAISKLHLNGDAYSKALNLAESVDSIEKYVKVFDGFYQTNFQFGVVCCYYHYSAAYFLLERRRITPQIFIEKVKLEIGDFGLL